MAKIAVNGLWDYTTRSYLQWHLKERKMYTGYIDGDFGPLSRKALQKELKSRGYYTGLIDGVFGPMSNRALNRFLNQHWGSGSFLLNSNDAQYYVAPWSSETRFSGEVRRAIQSGLNRHFGK